MGEKLIIGPINKGLKKDREPHAIDNDSFPVLINAYQWRGRVKRKRGTSSLGIFQRTLSGSSSSTLNPNTINLYSYLSIPEANPSIVPGSIILTVGNETYTDNGTGFLTGSPSGHAFVNYSTGVLIITTAKGPGNPINITATYNPNLPVMGLEDYLDLTQAYPGTVGFDTTYSYNINTSNPYSITDISFYKNPPSSGTYVTKTNATRLTWNGANYQQFWTTNYQGALWATNGIDIPFTGGTINMQFAPRLTITYVSNTTTSIVLTITGSPLVIGDFVFFNEWTGTNKNDLNFQTGYVTNVSGTNYTITFPVAVLTNAGNYVPGIIQYLTNRSNPTDDCIRWYDGTGWVNFMPPLSQAAYIIDDNPQAVYYLVGARVIVPFKDRLLFFGAVIQTSTGAPIYLQDCVVFSYNGTPYYTAYFTQALPILNSATIFNALLVPANQSADPRAYWEDQFGFGGFQGADVSEAITSALPNEDSLIVGFNKSIQARLLATGNDYNPFQFYIVNAELGTSSTFSAVTMDEGVISRGPRGFIITAQTSCSRFDLEIPDQVFQISNAMNGAERFCSQRDFKNEWIYFTYPSNLYTYVFPGQTLKYNYRDQSWAIFNEAYTTYGTFRAKTGYTWATISVGPNAPAPTWDTWDQPWNSGSATLLQPQVIAGNQQGFVLFRTDTTNEAPSLYIQGMSGNIITSPNHCLNTGDYIVITSAIGTIASSVNGLVFSVLVIDINTFSLSPSISAGVGSYVGGGQITRMYIPEIYSKQFPVAWDLGRKTRLGVQQYLFTNTGSGQITLLIFLGTDMDNPYNQSPIVPDRDSVNNGLIYSTTLYTCPESLNLGLTPASVPNMTNAANTNLQQINSIGFSGGQSTSSNNQQLIWHRVNTSLIGDTVQFGFTLNDAQMRDPTLTYQFSEIEFHAAILDLYPSSLLC